MLSIALIQKNIRKAVNNLPSLPAVVTRLLEVVERPDMNVEQVEKLLMMDAALSVKVLRLANSAYYGLSRSVGTIRQAVIILGIHTIKNLVLGFAAFQTLKSRQKPLIDEEKLWLYSFACAGLATEIARHKRINGQQVEAIFMGGLLNSIGLLFLSYHFQAEYEAVCQQAGPGRVRHEAEKEVLGIDHAEIGALIAHHWELPSAIVQMIADQHAPYSAQDENWAMVKCVALADAWLCQAGIDVDDRFAPPPSPEEAEQWVAVDQPTRETLIETVRERVAAAKQALAA